MRKSEETDLQQIGTWRIWKNVSVVTLSFMVHFLAYNGSANLQSSINAASGLGTASLAAMYAGLIVSNIFLPAIIIGWIGTKWTICFSFLTYMPFIALQWFPTVSFYTMVPAALLMGLGAGPLWCAKCTYLSKAAEAHSSISGIPAGTLLARFFGFFFMIYQLNQIWGNLISSLVLTSGNNTAAVTSINETMIPHLCGTNFLYSSQESGTMIPTQPLEKMQIITAIYLVCMVASTLIVALGLDSMKRADSKTSKSGMSGLALVTVTMKQMADPNQLLLLVMNIFLGQHVAFFGADFTASFVSCVLGTGSIGYVMMTYGLSDATGCVVTGYIAKLFGRLPLMVGALIVHGGVFVTMLVWQPRAGEGHILFVIAALWGLCDSVWTVQFNAYFGVLFRGKEEAAFSSYRLWESIGCIFSYSISSYVRTRYKVYMLLCNLCIGIIGYFTCEFRQRRRICKVEKEKRELGEDCVKY